MNTPGKDVRRNSTIHPRPSFATFFTISFSPTFPPTDCQRIPPQDQAALKTAQDLLLMQQSHRSHNEMVQECFMDCVKVWAPSLTLG